MTQKILEQKPRARETKDPSRQVTLDATAFELKVLRAISESSCEISAGILVKKIWPVQFHAIWRQQGKQQKMGAVLHRLLNKGFVLRRWTPTNQSLWSLSKSGKEVLQ